MFVSEESDVKQTSKAGTKGMPRAQRERQMVEAAERFFAERGFMATSMTDIAKHIGVTKPLLYEYFTSKEGLLLACIRNVRAQLFTAVAEATLGKEKPEELLRAGLLAFFVFISEHTQAWEILRAESSLIGSVAEREIETVRRSQTELITSIMLAFLPEGEYVFEVFAEMIVGACERTALWMHNNPGKLTPEQAVEHLMRAAWWGTSSLLS